MRTIVASQRGFLQEKTGQRYLCGLHLERDRKIGYFYTQQIQYSAYYQFKLIRYTNLKIAHLPLETRGSILT